MNEYSNNKKLIKPDEPSKNLFGWILLITPLFFIFIFIILPIITMLIMSFIKADIDNFKNIEKPFVLFDNFQSIFTTQKYSKYLTNTFFYTFNIIRIILITILPLFLAFMISKFKKEARIFIMIFISLTVLGLSSMFLGNALKFSTEIIWHMFGRSYNYYKSLKIYVYVIDILYNTGLISFIFLIFYLGIIKWSKENNNKLWERNCIGIIIILIISLGFSLQLFNPIYIIFRGDITASESNIMMMLLRTAFGNHNYSQGTAVSILLILPLVCLGFILGLIIYNNDIKIYLANHDNYVDNSISINIKILFGLITSIITLLIIFIFFLPHIILLITSFRTSLDVQMSNSLIPKSFTFYNFKSLNKDIPILKYSINTFIYCVLPIIFQLGISIPAGFALGKYRIRGRKIIFFILSSLIFITPSVLVIGSFFNCYFLRKLIGFMLRSHYYFISIFPNPIAIFLFTLFFDGLRIDLEKLKNKLNFSIKNKIKNKIIKNSIFMSLFVSSILFLLNIENMVSKTQFTGRESRTLMLGLMDYITYSSSNYPQQAAATIITLIPFFLILFINIIILQIFFFPKIRVIFKKD